MFGRKRPLRKAGLQWPLGDRDHTTDDGWSQGFNDTKSVSTFACYHTIHPQTLIVVVEVQKQSLSALFFQRQIVSAEEMDLA